MDSAVDYGKNIPVPGIFEPLVGLQAIRSLYQHIVERIPIGKMDLHKNPAPPTCRFPTPSSVSKEEVAQFFLQMSENDILWVLSFVAAERRDLFQCISYMSPQPLQEHESSGHVVPANLELVQATASVKRGGLAGTSLTEKPVAIDIDCEEPLPLAKEDEEEDPCTSSFLLRKKQSTMSVSSVSSISSV